MGMMRFNGLTPLWALILLLCSASAVMAANSDRDPSYRQQQEAIARILAAGGDPLEQLQRLQAEPGVTVPSRARPDGAAALNSNLARLRGRLEHLRQRQAPGAGDLQALSASYLNLRAADLMLQQSFEVVGEKLENAALTQFDPRLSAVQAAYQSKIAGLFEQLAPVMATIEQSGDLAALALDEAFLTELDQGAYEALLEIDRLQTRVAPRILGNTFLPYRRLTPAPPKLDTDTRIQPSYLDPDALPIAADLNATVDAPLAPEILAQAEALDNDYIRIYEFVKNNIHTEWYSGSMKGAAGTLRQGRGNDIDQANLLIALFRASGLASRYVHGVVELPIDAIANSLGLNDAEQTMRALAQAGIAHSPVIRGGQVAAVNIAHSWVSAYVPYTNYRGALVDTSGSIWLPLMPALKSYQVQAASGLFRQAGLVADELIDNYLQQPQGQDLQTQILALANDYLQQNQGGAPLASQLGDIAIKTESLGLLPNTLPVPVVAVNAEAASLSDPQRHRIRIIARRGSSGLDDIVLDYSAALSELASERVTLSYIGASVDDQKTINLFGGLDRVPAYLVKMRPQIKINGRQTAVGSGSIDTGIAHRFDIELTTPAGSQLIEQTVISGSYHALAIAAGGVAQQIKEDDPADTEYLGASLLSRLAYDYSRQWREAEQTQAGLLNVALLRPLPSIAVVSNDLRVDSLLGLPSEISWQAVTLDAALRVAQPIARDDGGAGAERDFMRLAALQGSSLEHGIFETLLLADSISADKGLQRARQQGIEILSLDSGNFSSERGRMTHPAEALADIENWVGLGYRVSSPVSAVSLNQWQGHVWRAEEPASGSGGYFIAGGLAGGSTTQAPNNWVQDWLRDALSASNTPPPNLNPGQAASISILADSNGQTGTVGKTLDKPLAVMVLDATSKPVQGATVRFSVVSGGGTIEETTQTDQFGVATANLRLGKKTSADPVYFKVNESDKWVTQAGLNVVRASITSAFGVLSTAQPFTAIGYPDKPTKLEINNPDIFVLGRIALAPTIFMGVQAQDEFGNSVSNVAIDFSAASMDKIDDCSVDKKAKVEAGGNRVTDSVGASATLIAGAGYGKYKLVASASGIAGKVELEVDGSGCSECVNVAYEFFITLGGGGKKLDAVKAGEKIARRGQVYLVDDIDGLKSTSKLEVSHKARTIGASISNERGSEGRYEFDLKTASSAGVNAAEAEVSKWRKAIEDSGNSCLTPRKPDDPPDKPLIFEASGAFGLDVAVTRVQSLEVPGSGNPGFVLVDASSRSVYPTEIEFNVLPATYEGAARAVYIYRDGALILVKPSDTLAGAGSVKLPPGITFDRNSDYEAELVLNRGSEVEIRSELFPLPVRTDLILSYSPQVVVQQQIDILNRLSCNLGSTFNFNISEPARVTLEFTDEINPSATVRLIDNESYGSGVSELPITGSDLAPGRYTFKLTAVSTQDGYTEERQGVALVEFNTSNNLPVGHTIVKGVDVYDGNLSLGSEDLSLPGRGVALAFNRNYSSNGGSAPGPLGVGWHHPYASRVTLTPCNEAIVIGGAGGGMRFVDDGQGGLKPLRGYHGSLIQDESTRSFDFYAVDGTRYRYRNFGRRDWDLEFIEDTNGNFTKLGYDPSSTDIAKLITVQDSAGRRLQFDYQDRLFTGQSQTAPVITALTAVDADSNPLISLAYEYDEFGNLICAVREDEPAYDTEDRLICSNRGADARVEQYGYVTDMTRPIQERHKLNSYTDANGNETRYEYQHRLLNFVAEGNVDINAPYSSVIRVDEPPASPGGVRTVTEFSYEFGTRDTTLTNARSFNNAFGMNEYGSVEDLQTPSGITTTGWTTDDVLPLDRTDANQVRSDFSYDANGNLLTETVVGTNDTRTYSYRNFDGGTIKNRPLSQQDRDGRTTAFAYDGRGNLVRETDPEGGVTEHSYNSLGDKVGMRDANGNTTRMRYDEFGNISETIDALGQSTRTEWNAKGLPVRVTDALGRMTEHEYDTLNRLVLTRNAIGGERLMSYDAFGNKLSETDELGRVTRFFYDEQNRLIRTINPLADEQLFEYDNNGNQTRVQDWNGNVTTFSYDDDDRLLIQTEPEGRTTSYTYDANGNRLTESITDGATTQTTSFAYDELNRVIQITDAIGGITRMTYDGEGNKLSETDELGRVTSFEYDGNQRLVKSTDADGGITRMTYDAFGNKTSETDANGRIRRFEYDALNRLVRSRDALGNTTTQSYDAVGNVVSIIDARLNETRFEYDALNRKIREIDPKNQVTLFTFDAVGNVTRQQLPNGNVVDNVYDGLNRLTRSTDTLGQLQVRAYDANGNVVEQRDANNNLTTNTYDGLNRLTQQDLPENRRLRMTYDVFDNVKTETDANNNVTRFAYDPLNRLVTQTDADNRIARFSYDAVDNRLTETDRRNNVTRFTYDVLNRVTTITDALSQAVAMTYDAVGNKLSDTDKRGTVTAYSYDAENRLLTRNKAGVQMQRLEYDAVGNTTLEQDANANKVVFVYDERNQLIEEARPLAAITRFEYDAMGDEISLRDPEGRITRSTYDLRRRLASRSNGENETENYAYDGNGNRTRLTRPNGNAWTYAYDGADRLTGVTDPLSGLTQYSYDNNGNQLTQTDANGNTTTYSYDALNRRTGIVYADTNSASMSYDANGNQTGMTDANGQSFTMAYDVLNRQTQKQYPVAGTDDLQSIVNQYDANNNLTQITETYSGATGNRVTQQQFDVFDRLVEKTDPQGERIRYSFDANGNRKSVTDPDGIVTQYHYDALNRVSEVVNAEGVTQYQYDRSSLKTRVSYPNGSSSRHQYDLAGRILGIENQQGLAVISSFSYVYDDNGNRTRQIETNGGGPLRQLLTNTTPTTA